MRDSAGAIPKSGQALMGRYPELVERPVSPMGLVPRIRAPLAKCPPRRC